MEESDLAAKIVTERFREIAFKLEELSRASGDVDSIAKKALMRLDVLSSPTAELKIKAVSAPSMHELGDGLKSKTKDIATSFREVAALATALASELGTGSVICNECKGKGEVEEEEFVRDEESVGLFVQDMPCSVCKGSKALRVPSDTLTNALTALGGLSSISHMEEST